jgi:hypothetical protein
MHTMLLLRVLVSLSFPDQRLKAIHDPLHLLVMTLHGIFSVGFIIGFTMTVQNVISFIGWDHRAEDIGN